MLAAEALGEARGEGRRLLHEGFSVVDEGAHGVEELALGDAAKTEILDEQCATPRDVGRAVDHAARAGAALREHPPVAKQVLAGMGQARGAGGEAEAIRGFGGKLASDEKRPRAAALN